MPREYVDVPHLTLLFEIARLSLITDVDPLILVTPNNFVETITLPFEWSISDCIRLSNANSILGMLLLLPGNNKINLFLSVTVFFLLFVIDKSNEFYW